MLFILLPGTQNLLAESLVCSLNFGWVLSTPAHLLSTPSWWRILTLHRLRISTHNFPSTSGWEWTLVDDISSSQIDDSDASKSESVCSSAFIVEFSVHHLLCHYCPFLVADTQLYTFSVRWFIRSLVVFLNCKQFLHYHPCPTAIGVPCIRPCSNLFMTLLILLLSFKWIICYLKR